MIAFICIFFPAIISVGVYEKLKSEQLSKREMLYFYALFNTVINFCCFFVKKFLLGSGDGLIWVDDMTPDIAFKYLVMALPLALAIPALVALLGKYVDVKVEHGESTENTVSGSEGSKRNEK